LFRNFVFFIFLEIDFNMDIVDAFGLLIIQTN